nr:peptide-methionine (S)-S-oxide reductase MsrA [Gleimia coleocanis]
MPGEHPVLGNPIDGPWEDPYEVIYVGMGCFWGVERIMWNLPGVIATATGYMGGSTRNPSYKAVCSGTTGHAEVVRVVFDPTKIDAEEIIKTFWENHDPTQGDRQGNDRGTQYRSVLFTTTERQLALAKASKDAFGEVLSKAGFGPITTEIDRADDSGEFFLAEGYHQAYLFHIPDGYCMHGPNGYACPTGLLPVTETTEPVTKGFSEVSAIRLT